MKLKQQNNSVFGIAILETRPDYNLWRATCQICKYIGSSPVRSFHYFIRLVVERRFRLLFGAKSLYFEDKNAMRLIYRVISSPIVYVSLGLEGSSALENSQMASSLSLIRVLCSTLAILSFPLEIEKNK